MYKMYEINRLTSSYLKILPIYNELKKALKAYILDAQLSKVFKVSGTEGTLFSIAGYEFGTSIEPFINKGIMFGNIGFHLITDEKLSESICCRLYLNQNGYVIFNFNDDGTPVQTYLCSDDSFEEEASRFANELLEPLASKFFESFTRKDSK